MQANSRLNESQKKVSRVFSGSLLWRTFLLVPLFLAGTANAQVDDEIFGPDDGNDYIYRAAVASTPDLAVERIEITLNPPMALDRISAVAGDAEGNLYLFQRNTDYDPVIVIDREGNLLRSFGAGLFSYPHSIRLDPQGNVWTVDATTSMIYKFSPQGEQLLQISVGDVPDIARIQRGTADIAFGPDGLIYVADGYANGRIVVFDATGNKVREWGQRGTGPGEFNLPHSLVVGPDGTVYVSDRENGRIQLFTSEGQYLREWDYSGRPISLDFAPDGNLYLSAEPRSGSMTESVIIRLNLQDGSFEGKFDGFGHQLGVGGDGTLLASSLSGAVSVYHLQ